MTASGIHSNLPNSRPMGYRLRRDIVWSCLREQDALENVWLATDPLTRQLFRCGEHEYRLLQWVHEGATIEMLVAKFDAAFVPKRIEPSDVRQLILRCAHSGMLRAVRGEVEAIATRFLQSSIPFGSDIQSQSQPNLRKSKSTAVCFIQWVASALRKVTQMQVSLGSPDRWLDKVAPSFGWLYSRTAVVLWLCLLCIAILLITMRMDVLWTELPSFHSLRSASLLVGFGVVFVVTRIFHELGHAFVCKRAGAACKDIGLIVSYGMICPYVDITDAWRVKNRFERMGIAMAGIYTEAIIASLAALVWWGTHPGPLHQYALQIMLVCSITTLLFNANPLLKYDGYFVLCDWLKVQNLRERSFHCLDSLLERHGCRQSWPMTCFLLLYFVASTLNRIVLTCAMIGLVYAVAIQWQLSALGLGAIAVAMFCSAILSLVAWTNRDATHAGSKNGYLTMWLGWSAVAVLVAWSVNIPLPNRARTIGEFQIGHQVPIYANASGRVENVVDALGPTPIEKSELLVQLANEGLERTLLDLECKRIRLDQHLSTLERGVYFEDLNADAEPMIRSQRSLVLKQLSQKQEEQERLSVVSQASGLFVPAIAKSADSPENPSDFPLGLTGHLVTALPTSWTASSARGRWLERGALIGWIIQDRIAVVECQLSEDQIAGIGVRSEARVRLVQHPTKIARGRVVELSNATQPRDALSKEGTSAARGPNSSAPANYLVRIELDEQFDDSEYCGGTAEVVLLRPSKSILDWAIDHWIRNVKLR